MPTRGVERWLAQRLSNGLGRHAGPPRRRLRQRPLPVAAGACSPTRSPPASGSTPAADPWRPERMAWTLLEVVEEQPRRAVAGDARRATWAAAPSRARGGSPRCATSPSSSTATRCTARRWSRGAGRRRGAAAPPTAWQAELWRRLRARIGTPDPAERIAGACARIAAEPELLDLPAAALASSASRGCRPARLDVLRALAGRARRPPVPAAPVAGAVGAVAADPARRRWRAAATIPTAALPRNRLLASWGRTSASCSWCSSAPASTSPTTTPRRRRRRAARGDPGRHPRRRTPPGPPLPGVADARPLLIRDDRSVAVHACHGRARQVEVLRDAVLHALADDPTLEPRDVIVMCPDIEAFAPLIHAAFGTASRGAGARESPSTAGPAGRPRAAPDEPAARRRGAAARARRRAADRLAGARSGRPRRRCGAASGSTTTSSPALEEWVRAARRALGARRGRTASRTSSRRRRGHLARRARPAAGRCRPGRGRAAWAGVLPLDDVDSGDIDLAGRLAELLDRLGAVLAALRRAAAARGLGGGAGGGGRRADRRAGARRLAARRARAPARRPGRGGRGRRAASTSCSRRSARCSPTASRAGRPARTSAPAT